MSNTIVFAAESEVTQIPVAGFIYGLLIMLVFCAGIFWVSNWLRKKSIAEPLEPIQIKRIKSVYGALAKITLIIGAFGIINTILSIIGFVIVTVHPEILNELYSELTSTIS